MDWMDDAACKGKTDLFFPNGHKDITYIAGARKICRSCPVKSQCLDYALEFPHTDIHGVWAGLTPRQLGAEQKKRNITPKRATIAKIWGEGK